MVNQKIKDYFLEGLKKGYKIEILKQKLLDAGFKKQEIKKVINSLNNPVSETKPIKETTPIPGANSTQKTKPVIQENKKLGIFKKIGKIIINPREVFESTGSEGIGPAFKYQIIILLIPLIILSFFFFLFFETIFSFILGGFGPLFGADTTLTVSLVSPLMLLVFLLFFAIFILIAIPILSFIGIGISHLFIKLYGGKGKYKDTYKAVIYGSTPQTLFGVIPIFNIFAYIWGIILTILGISINHKISKWRAFFALITPVIFFSALAFLLKVI